MLEDLISALPRGLAEAELTSFLRLPRFRVSS